MVEMKTNEELYALFMNRKTVPEFAAKYFNADEMERLEAVIYLIINNFSTNAVKAIEDCCQSTIADRKAITEDPFGLRYR
ncbi:MAG: hypothetical protein WC325_11835 [Candidatus Bathyarchaeia archaeon]|jgi:hypothetical protein